MFATDMQEKITNEAVFPDIHSTILEQIIKFIYTGMTPISDSNKATKILYVAEQFGIEGLKSLCVEKLMSKVTDQNVLEIFVIADMYRAKELEDKCLSMII
jgi:hypothetical protein